MNNESTDSLTDKANAAFRQGRGKGDRGSPALRHKHHRLRKRSDRRAHVAGNGTSARDNQFRRAANEAHRHSGFLGALPHPAPMSTSLRESTSSLAASLLTPALLTSPRDHPHTRPASSTPRSPHHLEIQTQPVPARVAASGRSPPRCLSNQSILDNPRFPIPTLLEQRRNERRPVSLTRPIGVPRWLRSSEMLQSPAAPAHHPPSYTEPRFPAAHP